MSGTFINITSKISVEKKLEKSVETKFDPTLTILNSIKLLSNHTNFTLSSNQISLDGQMILDIRDIIGKSNKIQWDKKILPVLQEFYSDTNVVELPNSSVSMHDSKDNAFIESLIDEKIRDIEQAKIIHVDPTVNILGQACPGAGKTYTLLKKIEYYIKPVEKSGLAIDPERLLLLSFSNFAVNELKERIRANPNLNPAFNSMKIYTVHEFSGIYLNPYSEIEDDKKNGYSEFLKSIIHNIKDGYIDIDLLSEFQHVFIDESQDIQAQVADLLRLLIEEMNNANIGFTILGDPHQAIFRFMARNNWYSNTTYEDFIAHIVKDRRFKILKLTQSERTKFSSKQKLLNETLTKVLENQNLKREEKYDSVISQMKNLEKINLFPPLNGFREKDIAILSYTNAQTTVIFQQLLSIGIQSTVNDTIKNSLLHPIFYTIDQLITQNNVEKLNHNMLAQIKSLEDSKSFWRSLNNFLLNSPNSDKPIDWLNLKEKILNVYQRGKKDFFPKGLLVNGSGLIVSTIHKVKGQEFDNVVINKSKLDRRSVRNEEELIDISRTVYVGITRAKYETYLLNYQKGFTTSPSGRQEKNTDGIKRHMFHPNQFYFRNNFDKLCFEIKPILDFEHLSNDSSYFAFLASLDPGTLVWINRIDQQYFYMVQFSDKKRCIGKLKQSTIDDFENYFGEYLSSLITITDLYIDVIAAIPVLRDDRINFKITPIIRGLGKVILEE